MKSAGNGGVLYGSLQVLHIHAPLVAPLGAGHMAKPGTDQHKGRVSVWETAHHTGAASDLLVQSFNDIVDTDVSPVLAGKIAVDQRFFNTICHLLSSLFQFHGAQLLHHRLSLFSGSSFAFLNMDCLKDLDCQLHLGTKRYRENIAVEVDRAPLVFGLRKYFSHGLQHTKALVANNESYAVQATATQPLEETDSAGLILFHAL